ncbi:glycosyltransferase family 4 protein [Kineococcus sp. SYSU DK004]|uniref:glycosyltransferase family 4 protein n=1 Tax=Kineococcus sp. SYSU DK004 TaxID=3383125 RepID=UPI003D7DA407
MSAAPLPGVRAGTRVVVVCLDPGVPVFGGKGCSVHVQEVLRVLAATGADVHVVTTRPGGRASTAPAGLGGVVVHHLRLPSGRTSAQREEDLVVADARAGALVRGLLRGQERDGFVYERYALFSCSALEAARDLGVPSVLEVNAPLPLEQARHRSLTDTAGADERTARALRAARHAVAVSRPVADWASAVAGVPVDAVPNGVDVDRFHPADPRRPDDGGELVVAFAGAFRPWHGVGLLVEAAARLREVPGRDVRLLLVGDGPTRAADLAEAARLGVAVDAPGALAPADVPAALRGADVAVAPYPPGRAYFSPLKVAEYLACGLPTVAAAVGDLAERYRDEHELLLVPPGDAAALAAALQRLRAEPALRGRLAAAGRRAVVERASWRRTVELSLAPAVRRELREELREEVPA